MHIIIFNCEYIWNTKSSPPMHSQKLLAFVKTAAFQEWKNDFKSANLTQANNIPLQTFTCARWLTLVRSPHSILKQVTSLLLRFHRLLWFTEVSTSQLLRPREQPLAYPSKSLQKVDVINMEHFLSYYAKGLPWHVFKLPTKLSVKEELLLTFIPFNFG